ncbi:hypothetical protein BGZ83_002394 [Gryganskiella cystojenkinii]|nr:hypothetical protein BGZ83_002394 [Gryganskiella cystojenkinii]
MSTQSGSNSRFTAPVAKINQSHVAEMARQSTLNFQGTGTGPSSGSTTGTHPGTTTSANLGANTAPGTGSSTGAAHVQDQDLEMGGDPHVGTPTLEQLVAKLNERIGQGNNTLNPGSYLPSFKKGVVTEQVAADILNQFVNKAAILLDKSKMAEKVLRELLNHTAIGYWGHPVVNSNRVTLSKEASQSLKTKYDELLIQTIRNDKANLIAQCNRELETGLSNGLRDALNASSISIDNNMHLNEAGKTYAFSLIKATATEFVAQVQALRTKAEFIQVKAGLKVQKIIKNNPPQKKGKGKPTPSRRNKEQNKFKGPKGPKRGQNQKKSGNPKPQGKKTPPKPKGKGKKFAQNPKPKK